MSEKAPFDAIVLAGGSSTRFGSDKMEALLEGRPVLEHVRDAVGDAINVAVVGADVTGGPVPAIAAGLAAGSAPSVVIAAGDQPRLGGAIKPLLAAVPAGGVAVLTREGRRHYLAAAWEREALVTALHRLGDPTDAAVRALLDDVPVVEVADLGGWSHDIDTPADLADLDES